MAKELQIYFDKDGTAKEYDDTYDVIIHCETPEEHDEVVKQLKDSRWIPVEERVPEEHEEFKDRFDGLGETSSDWFLWTLELGSGERVVRIGRTRGRVHWVGNLLDAEDSKARVIAWRPLPEPHKGE